MGEVMEILPLESLPVGYRFRPTDEELIKHYLRLKINGDEKAVSVIREIDVCKQEPWDLPEKSLIPTNDEEWFFFSARDRKYDNGRRLNRATAAGYWKSTGLDRSIKSTKGRAVIGKKKTLVFYTGRAPCGQRTIWKIHEYNATSEELHGTKEGKGSFVLCKLFKKHDKKLERKHDEDKEYSNNDEVDEKISSPATLNSLSDQDMQSPIVTLTTSCLSEKLPHYPENSVRPIADAPLPTRGPNNSCAFDNAEDASIVQGAKDYWTDYEPEEILKLLDDPLLEPLDGEGQIFSQLHPSMQEELKSSLNLHQAVVDDMDHGHKDQNCTTEEDFTDFLESILETSDIDSSNSENLWEISGGSNNYSSIAAANNQSHDLLNMPIVSSSNINVIGDSDIFDTGIMLRTRRFHDQPSVQDFEAQGSALRRIQLQEKLQVGLSYGATFKELSHKEDNYEGKALVMKAKESEDYHPAIRSAAINESCNSVSKSKDATEVPQAPNLRMISRSNFSKSSVNHLASLKVPSALNFISSFPILIVVTVIGLSIVFIGIWRWYA